MGALRVRGLIRGKCIVACHRVTPLLGRGGGGVTNPVTCCRTEGGGIHAVFSVQRQHIFGEAKHLAFIAFPGGGWRGVAVSLFICAGLVLVSMACRELAAAAARGFVTLGNAMKHLSCLP